VSERLQKFLARAGVASRRAAETMIVEGRITVNGQVVTRLGTRVDPERDAIRVDGTRLRASGKSPVYVLLNKPRGYVTTLSDPEGRPTVLDLVRDVPVRVFPVGRLDFHTEGLLLLTNDGDLANTLMHPRHGVEKTYLAKVRGVPGPESIRRLERGVVLEGRPTQPAALAVVRSAPNASWVEVTVREGRKHQVRRMLEAVGHPVQRLRRIRYGGIRLARLPVGRWRMLTPAEVERLRRSPASRRDDSA
jgi:pseudouridine synthase